MQNLIIWNWKRWFDDAAKKIKLGDSIGILAFEYKGIYIDECICESFMSKTMVNLFLTGPIFIGVKLIGDHFVPSGEESTRVNTTDSVVRQNINFDQDSEKEM